MGVYRNTKSLYNQATGVEHRNPELQILCKMIMAGFLITETSGNYRHKISA